MDHALRTFVDRRGELTNTNFHGRNLYKPKTLLENPSSHALYFKDDYNFDDRNPRARSVLDIGRYHLDREFSKKVKKEKKKLKLENEFGENGNRIYRDNKGNIIPTYNIGADGTRKNPEPKDVGLRDLFWEAEVDGDELAINQPLGFDSSDNEGEERKEATLGINEHFANIESIVNNENRVGLANLYENPDGFDNYDLFKEERWKFL